MLADADGGPPEVILLATGSEVHLALGAHEQLTADGIRARVVSMPCWELFDQQPAEYRDSVLPPDVEAGSPSNKPPRWAGTATSAPAGAVIGMDTFGTSAPLKELLTKFGFTPDAVAQAARDCMNHR